MVSQAPALRGVRAARGRGSGAYVALTKPRIIELLLVTTLPTMVVAQRGLPRLWLMVATLVGGLAGRRRGQRHQHVRRPRHRPVMHRTRQPAAGHRGGDARGPP